MGLNALITKARSASPMPCAGVENGFIDSDQLSDFFTADLPDAKFAFAWLDPFLSFSAQS